jgi:hypothetical protein
VFEGFVIKNGAESDAITKVVLHWLTDLLGNYRLFVKTANLLKYLATKDSTLCNW